VYKLCAFTFVSEPQPFVTIHMATSFLPLLQVLMSMPFHGIFIYILHRSHPHTSSHPAHWGRGGPYFRPSKLFRPGTKTPEGIARVPNTSLTQLCQAKQRRGDNPPFCCGIKLFRYSRNTVAVSWEHQSAGKLVVSKAAVQMVVRWRCAG